MTRELIDSLGIMINEGSVALEYEPYGKGTWYKHAEIGKTIISNDNTL